MKLPLFVSARPSVGQESPHVMIGKGEWKVSCSDPECQFFIHIETDPLPYSSDAVVKLTDVNRIFIRFSVVGKQMVDVVVESV